MKESKEIVRRWLVEGKRRGSPASEWRDPCGLRISILPNS